MTLIVVNREAFDDSNIILRSGHGDLLSECFWDAPKGFLSKSVLRSVHCPELEPLFQGILKSAT
jgi:hypothetical protein